MSDIKNPDPARAVVLINDMQNADLGAIGTIDALDANVQTLRDWARSNRVPVVVGVHVSRRSMTPVFEGDLWRNDGGDRAPDEADTVLTTAYSAFHETDLLDRMTQWGRDQLVICGVHTSVGCLATAMDAFMRGVHAFVVNDAVADVDADDHQRALTYIAARCGTVVDTAQVVAHVTTAPLRDWLKQRLSQMIEDDAEIDPDENLLFYGLDSLRVMKLAAELETRGVHVSFEQLARTPTLAHWYRLIETPQQAA